MTSLSDTPLVKLYMNIQTWKICCIKFYAHVMKLFKFQKTLTENFNQKTSKSSLWSKYEKIGNFFPKILLWMSSFDHKEDSVQVLLNSMNM